MAEKANSLSHTNNNYKFFSMIHDDWRDRNWFGNWMIYTADILKLFLSYENGEEVSETELLETADQLILDTDSFLGKPRACDLYVLENFMKVGVVRRLCRTLKWL